MTAWHANILPAGTYPCKTSVYFPRSTSGYANVRKVPIYSLTVSNWTDAVRAF